VAHSFSLRPNLPPNSPPVLLVNPSAGAGKAIRIVPRIREFALRHDWELQIELTSSSEDLAAKARAAAGRGYKQILVLGGDGTFQVLLNALLGTPELTLGIVPAGGGNDLACAIGLPSDSVAALALLQDGSSRSLDVVRVKFADGKIIFYCGGGGVGLDAEASRFAIGTFRKFPGRSRYLFSAIRALWRFQPIAVRALLDGTTQIDAPLLLMAVLNTPSYGAGVHLAPQALLDDGRLDLVCLEELSLWEILAILPALAWRGELNSPHIHRHRITRVRIETSSPRFFHGDGEILGCTPLEIEILPKAVRVLCPKLAISNT
jgi:diacylglycerol kinase (ATP)